MARGYHLRPNGKSRLEKRINDMVAACGESNKGK
jgi:hypothetical protein